MIECEPPNSSLYHFDGRLTLASPNRRQSQSSLLEDADEDRVISLQPKNIALQACVLRNTSWIIGVAIYTGQDTKFGQNKRPAPSKSSKLDVLIDKVLSLPSFCPFLL
jgi:magnesium-transporting ATPase (P-type)